MSTNPIFDPSGNPVPPSIVRRLKGSNWWRFRYALGVTIAQFILVAWMHHENATLLRTNRELQRIEDLNAARAIGTQDSSVCGIAQLIKP